MPQSEFGHNQDRMDPPDGAKIPVWRSIRLWWFLQRLEQKIELHSAKALLGDILLGKTVLSSQQFFIIGTKEYPGYAKSPLGWLSWILFWRLFESEERFNRRAHGCMNFFEYLIAKKYVALASTGHGFMPHLTASGMDIHGLTGLSEFLQQRYPLTWGATLKYATVLVVVAAGLSAGFRYVADLLKSLISSH